jgi:hypothetical protein
VPEFTYAGREERHRQRAGVTAAEPHGHRVAPNVPAEPSAHGPES